MYRVFNEPYEHFGCHITLSRSNNIFVCCSAMVIIESVDVPAISSMIVFGPKRNQLLNVIRIIYFILYTKTQHVLVFPLTVCAELLLYSDQTDKILTD